MTKRSKLFAVLCGFFVCNVILAQLLGVKIFALGPSLGMPPIEFMLFGIQGTVDLTAGVMLWPVVFILTDIINEYYGREGVNFISILTTILILYGFAFAWLAIQLAPAAWWPGAFIEAGVPDQQKAFAALFGQGMWAIAGSVTAFIVAQILDVTIFQWIKRRTGGKLLWARATGSTLISQGVDTFLVLYIMFVLGPQQWPWDRFFAIGSVNYGYKILIAIAMTPLIYLTHHWIDRYLAKEVE